MNESIKNICVKYLMNEANVEELDTLENWLHKPKNKQLFANYIKVNYAMDINMNPFDTERAKTALLGKIRKDKRNMKKRKLLKTVCYATAILVIALTSTYFLRDTLFNNHIENTMPVIVNNQIEKGTDKAILTLETGETIALEKGASIQTQNANSNGEEIIYNNNSASNKLAYNYLTIPRGGQFQLILSDGTKVWLNSETQLKFPVGFVDGETRQVELVYGEAYFDVSPSTAHKGANFKVFNKAQEIEVLGTEFNIKAYKDENNIYTTLVEGKVSINPNVIPSAVEGQNKILKPGQQSNVTINTKNMQVVEVDVFREIAWKQGVFSFKNKPLKEIMASLSRWYDMDVVFQNKALENVTFNGNLKKNQSIEEILAFIKGSINTYEINNKTIILK